MKNLSPITDPKDIATKEYVDNILSNAIPFYDRYVDNANSWCSENGYIKTSQQTEQLPEELTGYKDKWGVLLFIAENAPRGTGTQTFWPIDGNFKGTMWIRAITNKTSFSKWEKVAYSKELNNKLNNSGFPNNKNIVTDSSGNITTEDKYVLPTMSANTKGGAKIGNGLQIQEDILSIDDKYLKSDTNGLEGQFAVSDGQGSIRWETLINRKDIGA